jgi:hypothetical protein
VAELDSAVALLQPLVDDLREARARGRAPPPSASRGPARRAAVDERAARPLDAQTRARLQAAAAACVASRPGARACVRPARA